MKSLKISMRLWHTLEDLPGLAAPALEWRERLGTEFEQVGKLLRPTGEFATSIDCPSPGGDGCPRRIVDHVNGEIVAVCGDVPGNCDAIKLTRSNIVIHRIDEKVLCEEIANALGLSAPEVINTGQSKVFHVGNFEPVAGMRFPAYLVLQTESDTLEPLAIRLWGMTGTPFILMTPTRHHVELGLAEKLAGWKARTVALVDLLERNGNSFKATDATHCFLAEFRAIVMPEEEAKGGIRFPTPTGATWGNVTIKFLDGHKVSIRCKSESGVFNFNDMGMVDRRKAEPDVQWQFLRDLSDGRGSMSSISGLADRKNVKRKQTLNERLEAFFGIDGEAAVTWDADASEYRCRFQLIPD